jgi:hypothetical protein
MALVLRRCPRMSIRRLTSSKAPSGHLDPIGQALVLLLPNTLSRLQARLQALRAIGRGLPKSTPHLNPQTPTSSEVRPSEDRCLGQPLDPFPVSRVHARNSKCGNTLILLALVCLAQVDRADLLALC